MPESSDPLARVEARHHLEEVNHFILHDEGEIYETPGKLSLIWTDAETGERRFLAVKAAGEDQILVNGRRYPATEAGLRQALRACLVNQR